LTKVKAASQKPSYTEEEKGKDPMVLSQKEKRDIQILIRFVHIFCQEKHKKGVHLCESCSELLSYGMGKRFQCPHNPKPMCKKCETQCYNRKYRQKVREVMRFSGPYLIRRGRLDLLYHYLA